MKGYNLKSYKRICANPKCGKEFIGTRNQRYCCPKCRLSSEYIGQDVTVTKKKDKNKSLTETAVKARKLGMSYGKYVSMQYIKEQRERNRK